MRTFIDRGMKRPTGARTFRRSALLATLIVACAIPGPSAAQPIFAPPRPLNTDALTDMRNDRDPSLTAGGGALVTVWESDIDGDSHNDIVVARSTDGALTWTTPALIAAPADPLNHAMAEDDDARVYSDGVAMIAAWNPSSPVSSSSLDYVRSTDDGASWSAIGRLNSIGDSNADGGSFAFDGSGRWIAVWHSTNQPGTAAGTDSDLLVATSPNHGATWSAPALLDSTMDGDDLWDASARIASDGVDKWVVVWMAETVPPGPTGQDLYVSCSDNDGDTWTDPAILHAGSGDDHTPFIAVDDSGTWMAAWSTNGHAGSDRDVLVTSSADGCTWPGPVHLVNANAGIDDAGDIVPSLLPRGNQEWLATWWSTSAPLGNGTDSDLMIARSADAGITWSGQRLVNSTGATDDGGDTELWSLIGDAAGRLFAVWYSLSDIAGTGNDGDILIASTCGNGLVDTGECCDLGAANGQMGSGCTATCGCSGLCTVSRAECATAADCPGGQGCCGNATMEADETCDDGNLQDGDLCSAACQTTPGGVPPCSNARGPHILAPVSMRAKFKDKDANSLYEFWAANRRGQAGDFNLGPGQVVAPCVAPVRVGFLENDGSGGTRQLAEFLIDSTDWSYCAERPAGSGDELAKLNDSTEMTSSPAGVRKAQIQEKGNKVKFKFRGKDLAEILPPLQSRIRFCLHVGDMAGSAVLECVARGSTLRCQSTN